MSNIVSAQEVCTLLRRTLNRVDGRLTDHGLRVAWTVACMLRVEGRTSPGAHQNLCLLALLHDVGAFKTEEIDQLLRFELNDVWSHAVYGYLFLRDLSPLSHLAPAILYHHLDYADHHRHPVACAREAQLIHLADRLDVLLQTTDLSTRAIRNQLRKSAGHMFDPALVDLLFRTDLVYHLMERREVPALYEVLGPVDLSAEEIDRFLGMIAFTVDFRGRYTAAHTLTTASIAAILGQRLGFEDEPLRILECAALLHDMGKVAIPPQLLDAPGGLSQADMAVMRTHVTATEEILEGLDPRIIRIAARHHEKLDGSGYPRGLTEAELSMEDRIVQVADLLSALDGARSYKPAFSKEDTLSILHAAADDGTLCAIVVQAVEAHYDEIMAETQARTQPLLTLYEGFGQEYVTLMMTHAPQGGACSVPTACAVSI